MRWLGRRRAFLFAPLMAVMCGDNFVPSCGGKEPEHGRFACTMQVAGTEVACSGEWWHFAGSSEEREIHVDGSGPDGSAGSIWMRLPRDATPGEIRDTGYPHPLRIGVSARAGSYCTESSAVAKPVVLTALEPPAGSYDDVLTPCGGHPGAPGTTVALKVSF